VVIAPLLHIEAISDVSISAAPWQAILVTSANAAVAIAAHASHEALCAVPVFAVGQHSAQAMRAAGFADVTSADGDVTDLVRLVATHAASGARLVYLAGADRSGDLAGRLSGHGLNVHTAVVYRAEAAVEFPPAASNALAGAIDGVLHFSRRTAEAYVRTATNAGKLTAALKPAHYCLSARVGEPLAQAGAAIIRIASRPAEAALIELIDAE
jgi:uroporphyrinogen-III synthase